MLRNLGIALAGGGLAALINLALYGVQSGVWYAFILASNLCFMFNVIMDMRPRKKK